MRCQVAVANWAAGGDLFFDIIGTGGKLHLIAWQGSTAHKGTFFAIDKVGLHCAQALPLALQGSTMLKHTFYFPLG